MNYTKQIIFVASLFIGSLRADNIFTQWWNSISSSLSSTPQTPSAKITISLNLPADMKERDKIQNLAHSIFINNDKTLIKSLINTIHKNTRGKELTEIFARIITWALENEYANTHAFVQKLSHRVLRSTYQGKHPFKYFIFIEAIKHGQNDIVEYLLPKLSTDLIIEKDVTQTTPLEYAAQADNQEAVTIISQYIEKRRQEEKDRFRLFGAFVGGVTWGVLEALTTPRVVVAYPVYYHRTWLIW